ncbi:MAG TPA: amidohydrolase family protein [Stellaceae bacterium]|nr:amidohydrolase family protein [Stellaceae bacterium]
MSDQPARPTVHFPVDERWLAGLVEEAIEPERPIVDPHHHLWDRQQRYLFDELLKDLDTGHNILATVYLQCGSMYRADGDPAYASVGETEFVNGVAAMSASGGYGKLRACAGIVGHADLRRLGAAVEPILEAHLRAGGGRFRGIRNSSVWDADTSIVTTPAPPPRGLLGDARFREGFARLAKFGLSFDAWLYHPQIGELAALARVFPDTTIVLDHVGAPLGVGAYKGRRAEVFEAWRASIRDIARCPNVNVKLGGLGMKVMGFGFEEKRCPPASDELAREWRPYLETCIDAFGTGRAMFESNFPVDKQSCSYAVLWNAFKRFAATYSEAEKHALFVGTACRVYRIDGDAVR